VAALDKLVGDMIAAADKFASNADQESKDLSFQIRSLAAIYYIYTYSLLRTSYDTSITLFDSALVKEKSDVDTAKKDNLELILAKFNETQATYEAALQKGLTDCHNQGGGN